MWVQAPRIIISLKRVIPDHIHSRSNKWKPRLTGVVCGLFVGYFFFSAVNWNQTPASSIPHTLAKSLRFCSLSVVNNKYCDSVPHLQNNISYLFTEFIIECIKRLLCFALTRSAKKLITRAKLYCIGDSGRSPMGLFCFVVCSMLLMATHHNDRLIAIKSKATRLASLCS